MADEVYTENSEQTAETAANIMNITGQSDSKAENNRKKKKRADDGEDYGIFGTIYDAVSVIVASMVIISVVFTFCFRLVGVDGPSMNNTLTNGDWLIVTPYYSEPKYKDIVISTKKTAAEGNLVKRVIAVAGDVVDITDEGRVIVNGKELDEPYIISDGRLHGDLNYPVTVPDDCVMLMGDNRPVSWDSRYSDIGFAETEYLMGKARFRVAVTDPLTKKISLTSDRDIYANSRTDN